jgi:hypothetical protein
LDAIATVYLSAHRDPAFRARHGVPKRETLRPDAWASSIDWRASTVGAYSSVFIKRTSIEAWLGTQGATLSTSALREAPERKIKDEIRAQYDKAAAAKEKPPNVRQIVPLVQTELRSQGFNASGRQIQELAEADEFAARRWKPGATLKSHQRRKVP